MKRKKLQKGLALLLTSIMAFSVMGGCGSKAESAADAGSESTTEAVAEETADDTAEAAEAEVEAADAEPVTLKLITWTNAATTDVLEELNAKFTEKYPNITVEITAVDSATYPQLVQTRVAAADVDIIAQQQFIPNPDFTKGLDKPAFQQYIENGDFLDLTDQAMVQNWDANAVSDSASFEGKVYALPMSRTSYNGVFYNKTIFAEYGLDVPQTWDEFIAICETLKAGGVAPITVAGKDGWPVTAVAANSIVSTVVADSTEYVKGLWDGSKKFNDEESVEIFNRLEQFASYCEDGAMGIDYASVPGRFAAGKAAMLADGAWQAPQIEAANPELEFGYFPLPPTEKGSDVAQLKGKYDTLFAGSGKSPNTDSILKWLEFMSEAENYTIFINAVAMESTMPGVTSDNAFLKSLEPMSKNFQLQFEQAYKAPKGIGKFGGFQATQLKSLGGTVGTAQELADLAQSDWDTALQAAQ